MRNDTLVVEISGKRPGTKKQRPTERFKLDYPHIIISNNSEGYDTEWEIINVPDDYREWYINNIKHSDNAWYAPMNRSYAIKYAREKGYKYLIQLDDNIERLDVAYRCKTDNDIIKTLKFASSKDMMNEFIDMLTVVLDNTNAGMAGFSMMALSIPNERLLVERYVYSFFGLKLDIVPDIFQGSFEDDIEFRLKLAQMGIPAVQICPMRYSKTGQGQTKDLSGCRAEYLKAGTKRGEQMSKLYGKRYCCGMRGKSNSTSDKTRASVAIFKHRLQVYKLGVLVNDKKAIDREFKKLLKKYSKPKEDKYIIKEKEIKG